MTLNEIKGNMKHVFQNSRDSDCAASPQARLPSGQHKQGQPLSQRGDIPVLWQQLQVPQRAPAQSGAVGGGRSCLGRVEGLLASHKACGLRAAEGRLVLQPWVSGHAGREQTGLLNSEDDLNSQNGSGWRRPFLSCTRSSLQLCVKAPSVLPCQPLPGCSVPTKLCVWGWETSM